MIKININGQDVDEEVCLACKEGWTKGEKGACYQEHMQGHPCKMDGCEHCMEFDHKIAIFGKDRVCFKCSAGWTREWHDVARRLDGKCHPYGVNHCYTHDM